MRHLKKEWKLKRTSSHRRALLRNLAISLLEHKKIVTTVAKAKALRPFVEKIITRAKRAVLREKNGQLPAGQKIDLHARRVVAQLIPNKAILQELFDTIAPTVLDRPGGYTRIVKLGFRRGDAAELAAIELVDWGAPQDGNVSLKKAKKKTSKKTTKVTKEKQKVKTEQPQVETVEVVEAKKVEEQTSDLPESSPDVKDETVSNEKNLEESTEASPEQSSDISPIAVDESKSESNNEETKN